MARLVTCCVSVVVIAAIGAGVAAAGSGYGGEAGKSAQIKRGVKPKERAKWRQFKDYEVSKAAFSAYLTGDAEVNDEGNDGAGDPDAKGSASFMAADEKTLCYGVMMRGGDTPQAMHIHRAPAGENGDIVISFKNPPLGADGQPAGDPGAVSGCKPLTEQSEIDALTRILSNPKGYYLNVHTASRPDGAIRGQLSRMYFDND